jgi:DNA primase
VYTRRSEGVSVFDLLRDEIHLEQLLQVNGHRKIRCISPSHEDQDPSMQVYDDHVHCFGCLFHGDVVDVWSAQKGITRPIEAALDLAREFSVRLPEMTQEGRRKAEEKRLKQAENIRLAQACHHALEKNQGVCEWWEGRGFDSELRERFVLGTNKDGTEAVIPFWSRGRVVGLIRRKLEGDPKYILPKAEVFPEGHRPLFIPGATPGGETFLVEGYVDALALAALGKAVVAVGGTGASGGQVTELRKALSSETRIYILPDRDDRGEAAATTWARALYPTARICPADYAAEDRKDVADLFAREATDEVIEHLSRLVSASRDILDLEMEIAAPIPDRRERLAYTSKNIAPLLAPLHPDGYRDATADIVAETTNLKKTWITKAIKDHRDAMASEELQQMMVESKAEAERRQEEYRRRVAEVQDEIDDLLAPGVLARLRDTAAGMHQVYGDREPLELALLVALGAQLDTLPNGRPLGASILLTAPAGRGKNHIVDAAVTSLPEEFYVACESASGQSLYYKADEDPDFLKHTFAYPNEIEGAEALWEFLRPMLSKGWAKKIVTAKDADGNMTTRTIIVEGPVTIAIPTIRNKTDEQLQTRLLVAELPDYIGRVKHHAAAVSEQLLPDAATADYSRERWLWQEGLRSLTAIRRVVFPLRHPDFALDDDQVSHGARLWANLLSLMVTNSWLEQKNRHLLDLGEERIAIEATPDDYEEAYRIFTRVCKRTVVNLSETHRKILGGLYDLHQECPNREGFTQREIAEEGGVSLGAVSTNKTFLSTSAKLLKETDDGLVLVEGANPSWWEEGDLMRGLPTPEQVWKWWEDRDPPTNGNSRTAEHAALEGQNSHTYAGNCVQQGAEQALNALTGAAGHAGREEEGAERVHGVFSEEMNSGNGIGKPSAGDGEGRVQLFSGSGVITEEKNGHLTEEQARKYQHLVAEGMAEQLAAAAVRGEGVEL